MAFFDALFWAKNGFASVNLHYQDESVLILSSEHKYVHLVTHWSAHAMHRNIAVNFWQLYFGKSSFIVLVPGQSGWYVPVNKLRNQNTCSFIPTDCLNVSSRGFL